MYDVTTLQKQNKNKEISTKIWIALLTSFTICIHKHIYMKYIHIGFPFTKKKNYKKYKVQRLLRVETVQNKCKNDTKEHNHIEVTKKDDTSITMQS